MKNRLFLTEKEKMDPSLQSSESLMNLVMQFRKVWRRPLLPPKKHGCQGGDTHAHGGQVCNHPEIFLRRDVSFAPQFSEPQPFLEQEFFKQTAVIAPRSPNPIRLRVPRLLTHAMRPWYQLGTNARTHARRR